MKTDIPSSAITSWSGFLYQGQIALLHTLKVLRDDINSKYSLQLDSLEDFAIVNDSSGVIVPISMHQVKAYKSTSYSTYESAFQKLNNKKDQCDKLFFHVARKLSDGNRKLAEKEFTNIKFYEYKSGIYNCTLDVIKQALSDMTKEVYVKHFPADSYKIVDSYIARSIHIWTEKIIEKVIEIHQKTHDGIDSDDMLAFTRIIPLEDFRNVLYLDLNTQEDNDKYFKYLALEDFQRYYEEFMYEFADDMCDEERGKLDEYMNQILGMDLLSLERFIKGINPDREYRFHTISDYKDSCLDKVSLEDVFFELLKCLVKGFVNECHIQWKCKEGNCYSPTAISRSKDRTSYVCCKIIENSKDTDVTLLFEGNTLITKENISKSLYEDAGSQLSIDDLSSNHIMRVSNIGLTDMDTARGVLNEERD